MRSGILMFVAMCSVVACAKDLKDQGQFPCADDGTCPTGFSCTSSRVCVPAVTCTPPEVDCGGVCTTPNSDPENCGACGVSCEGLSCCNGACVDPLSDSEHCGQCGNHCESPTSCIEGTCSCEAGKQLCGNTCTTLSTDRNNCGACGKVCPADATCANSKCVCSNGGTECSGSCIAPDTCTTTSPVCGCDANENCAWRASGNRCEPAGTQPSYALCDTFSHCAINNICVENVCLPFCSPSGTCPDSGSTCASLYDAQGNPIPTLKTCSRHCDPVFPTASDATHLPCGEGVLCLLGPNGPQCAAKAGTGTQGATCAKYTDCAAGYYCLNTGNGLKCARHCVVGTGLGCSSGQQCYSFQTPQWDGSREIGVCQ